MPTREQHPDRLRWNDKYRAAEPARTAGDPAAWLAEHEALLVAQPRGPALDVAAGRGRNALYLAQLGFAVEAVDLSDVALAALEQEARARDLRVATRWMDLESERLPEGRYRVVTSFNYLQRELFDSLEAALIPGGLLFFETMCRDHVEVLGRSFNPAYTLTRGELRQAFGGLEILEHREGITNVSGQQRGVASLVARRPE